MEKKAQVSRFNPSKVLAVFSLLPMVIWLSLVIFSNLSAFAELSLMTFESVDIILFLSFIFLPIFSLATNRTGKFLALLCLSGIIYSISAELASMPKFGPLYPAILTGITLYYGVINILSLKEKW